MGKWTSTPTTRQGLGDKMGFKKSRSSKELSGRTNEETISLVNNMTAQVAEMNHNKNMFRKPYPPKATGKSTRPSSLPNTATSNLQPRERMQPKTQADMDMTITNLKCNMLAELMYGSSIPDYDVFSRVVQQLSNGELPPTINKQYTDKDTSPSQIPDGVPVRPTSLHGSNTATKIRKEANTSPSPQSAMNHVIPDPTAGLTTSILPMKKFNFQLPTDNCTASGSETTSSTTLTQDLTALIPRFPTHTIATSTVSIFNFAAPVNFDSSMNFSSYNLTDSSLQISRTFFEFTMAHLSSQDHQNQSNVSLSFDLSSNVLISTYIKPQDITDLKSSHPQNQSH